MLFRLTVPTICLAVLANPAGAADLKASLQGKTLVCGLAIFAFEETGAVRIGDITDEDTEFVSLPAEVDWKPDQVTFRLTSLGKSFQVAAKGDGFAYQGNDCYFQ